jgi:hypothetical protein
MALVYLFVVYAILLVLEKRKDIRWITLLGHLSHPMSLRRLVSLEDRCQTG